MFLFQDVPLNNSAIYTSVIASPPSPSNDSSDWVIRSHIGNERVRTFIYDPPILVRHVAVIRSDNTALAMLEVMVSGESDFKSSLFLNESYCNRSTDT